MAWHTPRDPHSHTCRLAEKCCRYPSPRAHWMCRPPWCCSKTSHAPTHSLRSTFQKHLSVQVCAPHIRHHTVLKITPTWRVVTWTPCHAFLLRVPTAHALHVLSCTPGSHCCHVSCTPSCRASPPQSHAVSHPVVCGDPCSLGPPRSCHMHFHKHCSQLHVTTHNCEVSHRRPHQTLSSETPRHMTSLPSFLIWSHTDSHLHSWDFGLWWFYFTKALKVQAKGWLGKRAGL